jgi:hypothetical protein
MMELQYNSEVKSIGDALKNYTKPEGKIPRHEKSAIVDEIKKVVKFNDTDKYGYKYWLRMIGQRSYGEMMGILKEIEKAPSKFPKGALLTNKLRKKKV